MADYFPLVKSKIVPAILFEEHSNRQRKYFTVYNSYNSLFFSRVVYEDVITRGWKSSVDIHNFLSFSALKEILNCLWKYHIKIKNPHCVHNFSFLVAVEIIPNCLRKY